MKLLFQVETWERYSKDAEALWPLHYQELALNQDRIKLDVDRERYAHGEKDGNLIIVTARDGEKLVGYCLMMIVPHFHYKSSGKMGYVDVYYLLPEYRKGGNGARLFMAMEIALKAIGVRELYQSTKIHKDESRLFEALGYKKSDIILRKYIGD